MPDSERSGEGHRRRHRRGYWKWFLAGYWAVVTIALLFAADWLLYAEEADDAKWGVGIGTALVGCLLVRWGILRALDLRGE